MYVAGHRAAGNGSLMRTTPIVLGFLDDPQALTAAARAYSDITHGDPVAAEACVLWNHAQRHAVVHAEFDMTVGLSHLPSERQEVWRDHIRVAESGVPRDFRAHNGWVVAALQAAWSAIRGADDSGPEHFEMALRSAVAGGNDADTVAAIAGGLLGARWGVSAIPLKWRRLLHGAPGSRTGQQLVQYSVAAVTGHRWPEMFNEGVRPGPHRSGTHTTSTCGSETSSRSSRYPWRWTRWCRCAGSGRSRVRTGSKPKITSRCGCSMTRTRVRIRIWIWLFGRQSI